MRSLDFENDIPESLACAAHSGTSMVPERRAVQERASYAQELRTDYEGFRQHAEQGGNTLSVGAGICTLSSRRSPTHAKLSAR